MAYFRKTSRGWRVEVARKGVRVSATFPHKATAQLWASEQENAILSGAVGKWPAKTVADAIARYEREVSSQKRGERFESIKFRAFERDFPALAKMLISEVKTPDLVEWRDARLQKVTKGSVQREVNLLRNVWTVASKEWHWCGESPWTALRAPGDNPARTQRIRWQDVKRIVRWLGYKTGQKPTTKYQEVAWAFMVALRTAMRAGEVMGLTREAINLQSRVITLKMHKTVEEAGTRFVPFNKHAARILNVLCEKQTGRLWQIKPASLDALFRKARDSCLLGHIHFHDSRAEALTLLARRVDVMTLARISGHRDLRQLLDAYYRESPEQIAARL
jgi:integrase